MKSTFEHEARVADAPSASHDTGVPEVNAGRASAILLTLGVAVTLVLALAAYHRYDNELQTTQRRLSAIVTSAAELHAHQDAHTAVAHLAETVTRTGYALFMVDAKTYRASSSPEGMSGVQGPPPLSPRPPLSETVLARLQHSLKPGTGTTVIDVTAANGTAGAPTLFSCTALTQDDLLICATADMTGTTDSFHMSLFTAVFATLLLTGGALYTLTAWHGRVRKRLAELKDTIATLQGQNNACATTAARFAALFDLAEEAMYVMAGGHIVKYNQTFANMIRGGNTPGSDDGILHAVHPDDSLYVSRIQAMRQRGEPTPTRIVFRLRDTGQGVRWVQCTSSVIPWDEGRAHLSVLSDITDFKQSTLLVEQREQALLRVVEQLPYALAVLAPDGSILQTNGAWRDLMHTYTAPGMTAASIFENPLVMQNGHENAVQEALTGAPVETEAHPVPSVHGEARRWLRLRFSPVRDHHGRLQSIIALYSDETLHVMDTLQLSELQHEITRLHETSSAAHGRLHAVLDALPWAIVTVDGAGRVTFINGRAAVFADTDAEAVHGLTVEALPPVLARYAPMLRASLRSGTPQPSIRNEEYISGRMRHLEAASYPIDAGGQEADKAAFLCIEDVTERVALEDMMVQSEKMVSVGALAAGMAHEINNPLGAILQGVQNLRRRLTADLPANVNATSEVGLTMEQLRAYVESRQIPMLLDGIREAGERAGRIVSHMLTFSRRSQGLHRPAHLGPLIDKALELVETDYDLLKAYDFKQIEVFRDEEPDLPPFNCSSSEIEQVILNLLKNAAHAVSVRTDDAPPRIRITTRSEENGIRLEIADNGPGMTAEQRRRAFEPFFTTREVGMGTGLGLSICYFIITTKHRGTIAIDAAPEGGVQFTIRLPF